MTPSLPQDDADTTVDALAALVAAGAGRREELSAAYPSVDSEAALGEWDHTVEALAGVIPAVIPAAEIKQQLLSRISTAVSGSSASVVLRREEGWKPMGLRGVKFRLLFADVARQRMTIQLHAEPGARIPAHRHRDAEECLILQGDLSHGADTYTAGDYFRCAAGTQHHDLKTVGGCLCLIITELEPALVVLSAQS